MDSSGAREEKGGGGKLLGKEVRRAGEMAMALVVGEERADHQRTLPVLHFNLTSLACLQTGLYTQTNKVTAEPLINTLSSVRSEKGHVEQQRCAYSRPGQDKEYGQLGHLKPRKWLFIPKCARDVQKERKSGSKLGSVSKIERAHNL